MLSSKAKNKILYNILFWVVLYLFWVFILRNYSFSLTKTLTIEFCYLIFITADYYIITHFIIPKFLKRKKYYSLVLSIVLLILFSALCRAAIASFMNAHIFANNSVVSFGSLYLNSIINILIWVELVVMGKMIFDKIYDQQQLVISEKERVKNELDFLKAQINPHSLFNSLNSIYGHIDKSNQVARDVLLQFSNLLRYQLYDCTADRVSLEKEIAYLKNYIAFEQLRKGDNLCVDLNIDIAPNEYTIAPLLLIVLVENAFKFVSISTEKTNNISIGIAIENNLFIFSVYNTTDFIKPLANPKSSGIGLSNLKRRLELLYPNKYTLNFSTEVNAFKVTLKIETT